jgi:hypothetical protein
MCGRYCQQIQRVNFAKGESMAKDEQLAKNSNNLQQNTNKYRQKIQTQCKP